MLFWLLLAGVALAAPSSSSSGRTKIHPWALPKGRPLEVADDLELADKLASHVAGYDVTKGPYGWPAVERVALTVLGWMDRESALSWTEPTAERIVRREAAWQVFQHIRGTNLLSDRDRVWFAITGVVLPALSYDLLFYWYNYEGKGTGTPSGPTAGKAERGLKIATIAAWLAYYFLGPETSQAAATQSVDRYDSTLPGYSPGYPFSPLGVLISAYPRKSRLSPLETRRALVDVHTVIRQAGCTEDQPALCQIDEQLNQSRKAALAAHPMVGVLEANITEGNLLLVGEIAKAAVAKQELYDLGEAPSLGASIAGAILAAVGAVLSIVAPMVGIPLATVGTAVAVVSSALTVVIELANGNWDQAAQAAIDGAIGSELEQQGILPPGAVGDAKAVASEAEKLAALV